MILVLVAVLVAMPLAFYAMSHWLESFAYRTDVGLFTFIGAGGLALVIAWLTVGYQSFRAALANPVVSIRNE